MMKAREQNWQHEVQPLFQIHALGEVVDEIGKWKIRSEVLAVSSGQLQDYATDSKNCHSALDRSRDYKQPVVF